MRRKKAPFAVIRGKNLIYIGLKIRLVAGEKNCLKRVSLFVPMPRLSGTFCMFDTNTDIPFTQENCIFLDWRIFVTLGIVKGEFHALLTCKTGCKKRLLSRIGIEKGENHVISGYIASPLKVLVKKL